MGMGPIKPEQLDPIVKAAALNERKTWIDGPIFCIFASEDGEVMLGQVTKTKGGWDSFDLQHTNSSQTAARSIGHFQGIKEAKRAVEDYWSIVG